MAVLNFRDYLKSKDESGQLFKVPFEVDTLDEMGADCTIPLGLKVMDRVVRIPGIEARIDKLWSKL